MAPKTRKMDLPAPQDGLGILFPLQGQQPRTIKKPCENQHFASFPVLAANLGFCLASCPQHGPQDLQDDHHKPQDAPKSLPKVAFQAPKIALQAPKMAPIMKSWGGLCCDTNMGVFGELKQPSVQPWLSLITAAMVVIDNNSHSCH